MIECARHRLKMICANPDLAVIRGGVRVLCAGALAVRYQELGGDVRSLGKPDPAIYQPVLEQLGLPPDQVMAVGDSLHTDIAGAVGVDLAACWVLDGIHGDRVEQRVRSFDIEKAERRRQGGLRKPCGNHTPFCLVARPPLSNGQTRLHAGQFSSGDGAKLRHKHLQFLDRKRLA